jgi:hypothetical protein
MDSLRCARSCFNLPKVAFRASVPRTLKVIQHVILLPLTLFCKVVKIYILNQVHAKKELL